MHRAAETADYGNVIKCRQERKQGSNLEKVVIFKIRTANAGNWVRGCAKAEEES